jgi:hypothetical protein
MPEVPPVIKMVLSVNCMMFSGSLQKKMLSSGIYVGGNVFALNDK